MPGKVQCDPLQVLATLEPQVVNLLQLAVVIKVLERPDNKLHLKSGIAVAGVLSVK